MDRFPNKAMRKLNSLTSQIDAVYHQAAKKLGLSDSVMFILYMVYDNGGKRLLGDITSSGISKQTINSSLRKLEKEGVAYLEGRKNKTVCLTAEGMALARDTVSMLIDTENRIFESWSEEEVNIYLELTERFCNNMKNEVEKWR